MAGYHLSEPPPFLATPGEPPIPWSRWIDIFENFAVASGIPGDKPTKVSRKRAILIHCLGTEGQRIFRTLEETYAYDDTISALQNHFVPKRSVIMERWHFRHREQRPGESIRQFVLALTELASTCKFEALTNELIRDQLIEKTTVQRIRERLLMEPDTLSLNKAVNLASQIEEAMAEAKVIENRTAPMIENRTSVQVVKKTHSRNQGKKDFKQSFDKTGHCFCCGSSSHYAKDKNCPAKGKKCGVCGKLGHFARMCKSKGSVKMVSTTSDSENTDYADTEVYSVKTKDGQFKTCQVNIDNKPVTLLIDLGSKVSILNEAIYKSLFPQNTLQPANQTLLGYDDSSLPMLGMTYLDVELEGQVVQGHRFYVSKKGSCLLGVDLFDKLNFEIHRQGVKVQTVGMVPSDIYDKYPTVFSGFGVIKGFVHKPSVNPNVAPVSQKLRRIPLSVRDEVATELRRLEGQGIIEKIDSSPWISNLVIARRKTGEIRLCVDLKEVNKCVIPDKFPLPTMEELASEFHGSTVFSKLDLRRSYLQVNLKEECRYLTAFITHEGVYQYCRLPYGLSSSPSAFQKILSSILSGIKGAPNQIDDIVVHGRDQKEHDERLDMVLQRLAQHDVTVNAEKCTFSASEIDFLGYKVSSSGVLPTVSNVKAIVDLKAPGNRAELLSFLGAANFYLKFVPNFADKAEPLRKLLRKDVPWEWGESQTAAFECIKRDIASPPILAHFDPDAETYVSTDASGIALGAVLSQVVQGEERPVSFCSRTLTETERKYSTGEREALACIYACEHWHIYLFGRKFVLRTDHQALTTLLATSGSGHRPLRIYRWSDRLHQYNFDVQYVSGKNNLVPDMLSRLVKDEISADAETLSQEEEKRVMSILTDSLDQLVTPAELKACSRSDDTLCSLRGFIEHGWPNKCPENLDVYFKMKDELFIFDAYCVGRGQRAVIPESLRQRVLNMAHEGHPGIVRTKQRCRGSVWWPGIDRQIEQFVRDCEPCVISEKSLKPVSPPAQSIPWPKQPWQQLQIDIFGEVQIAPQNKRFLVVVHDRHSKWPEIAATGTVTSEVMMDILTNLFTRWGVPETIISDNGPQFTSHIFKEFLDNLGIEHRLTSRYNPQSNGGVERFNRVIKEGLKANMAAGKSFSQAIQSILLNYRATAHGLTQKTPSELMIGRNIKLPLDRLRPSESFKESELSQNIQKRQKKSESYTDAIRKPKTPKFKPGDWVRTSRPVRSHKLSSCLSQPRQIDRQLGKYSYQLQDGTRWNARRLIPSSAPQATLEPAVDVLPAEVTRPQRTRRPPAYLSVYDCS